MKKILLLLISIFCVTPIFASYKKINVPDSSSIRKQLVETWFEASLDEVREKNPEIYSNSAGQKFQVRLEETETTYKIVVAAGVLMPVTVISKNGESQVDQVVYPGTLPGSVHLIKDKKTDKSLSLRYFYSADSDVYVQFSPYAKTSIADVVVFNYYAAKGVSTGVPFENFYTCSFDDAVRLTQKSLPWEYISVDETKYDSIIKMVSVIKKNLGKIMYTPESIYDENNNLVSEITGKEVNILADDDEKRLYLSSAGFVKWIADGLVKPVAGSQLKRGPLVTETVKVKDVGNMGVFQQNNSAFFALNWIRNMSSAIISVYTNRTYTFENSGVDVNINPFASKIGSGSTSNTINFVKDNGYNADVLKSLLYVLAVKESGTFYFGAIRQTDRTRSPEIKVFNDCVVFFPYFNSGKGFECKVFMNGREMSLENFCITHKEDYIYLTKARSSDVFYPYLPESE